MCGRYYVPDDDSAAELHEIIEQINRRVNAGPVVKTGEIAPSDVAPVLANNRNLAATPFARRWGYRLGDGKLLFNARSETADAKALFREGMRQRRCLVPAAHYFEWEKRGKDRIKYAIRPVGASVMYMAGIYRIENGAPRVYDSDAGTGRSHIVHPRPNACHSPEGSSQRLAQHPL